MSVLHDVVRMEEVGGLPALERFHVKSESTGKDVNAAVCVSDSKSLDTVLMQPSTGLLSGTDDSSFTFLYDFCNNVPGAFGNVPLLSSFPSLNTGMVQSSRSKSPPTPPPLPITTSPVAGASTLPSPPAVTCESSGSFVPGLSTATSDSAGPFVHSPPTAAGDSAGAFIGAVAHTADVGRRIVDGTALSPASQATLFHSREQYHYSLEAPTSMINVRGEDTITYLNKGQFYTVTFEANLEEVPLRGPAKHVRSDLFLVFREEKDARSELQHWEYWHSQQANPNQRAVDVDRKAFKNIESFEDRAFNTYSFVWDPNETAKVVIRLNCLSTEFSSQKGVKGIPLYLQVDTFEDLLSDDPEPVHRCYCKVKVFRDKGAERKNKDESKTADRRMAKILKNQSARKRRDVGSPSLATKLESSAILVPSTDASGFFVPPSKVTHLLPTSTLGRKPVPFIPSVVSGAHSSIFNNHAQSEVLLAMIRDREAKRTFSATLLHASDQLDDLDVGNARKMRAIPGPRTAPAVTVYVRKEEEKVYNAIIMDELTVQALSDLIGRKYGVPGNMIRHVYKRTKRGILVNMDDRMVEQFANEDDFIVQLDFNNQLGHFELFLSY